MAKVHLKLSAAEILQQLHEVAEKNAQKKVKGFTIKNGILDKSDEPKLIAHPDKKQTKQKALAFISEYVKYFFGEESAKLVKSSDIKEEGEDFTLEVNDSGKSSSSGSEASSKSDDDSGEASVDLKTGSDEDKPKKQKKSFSIFSGVTDAAKQVLAFARSIHITVNGEPKFPIGKMLFGTTHDIKSTDDKVKKALDDEFPNNNLNFKILNSESVYNLLVIKYGVLDKTAVVCKKLHESKYTFCAYVEHDDPNYDLYDERSFKKAFNDSLGFTPAIVHKISNFDKSVFKNTNRKDFNKAKSGKLNKKLNDLENSLMNEFALQKKKLESDGEVESEKLEQLKDEVIAKYKKQLEAIYNDAKAKGGKDFDSKERLKRLQSEMIDKHEQFELLLDGGNDADKKDLYLIPLTAKWLFKRLRNSFETYSSDNGDK